MCLEVKSVSKCSGKRPQQRSISNVLFSQLYFAFLYSTIKQDCKAGIKLGLSEDGQYLVVTEVNEEHNHNVSKVSCSSKKLLYCISLFH